MFAGFRVSKAAAGRSLRVWLLIVPAVWVGVSGCVQRRMTIRSSPPGARVYVDDYEIGTTPTSHNFTYYGKRKIRLVKDGYETLTVVQPIPAPWYQIPPLDFVSENFIPGKIRDRRTFNYQLTPQMIVPTEQLLGRAEGLRRGVRSTSGVSPWPVSPSAQVSPAPAGPEIITAPAGVEPVPTLPGVGGQPVYPLPPSGR